MTNDEILKYASKVDPIDIMIRADEARKIMKESGTEDALAYAMAIGVRLGIKAVLENKDKKDNENEK